MEKKNAYIDSVLAALKEKQALALQEFEKTDLNSLEQYGKITNWFIQVADNVKRNPPERLVKRLILYENSLGMLVRVAYDYHTNSIRQKDPIEICVYSDLF